MSSTGSGPRSAGMAAAWLRSVPTTSRQSVLAELLARHPEVDPARVDDVILGCANQAGEDNRKSCPDGGAARGVPVSVPGVTVNRLCASGLDAVAQAARAVVSGDADIVIAGGWSR